LIHAAYKSVCRLAIIPLQDIFGLGGDARFNIPGSASGNWQWRFSDAQLNFAWGSLSGDLRELADNSGRQRPRAQRPKNSATNGASSVPASSKT
jgi:4-alpha-glucanotransferase